MAKTKDDQTAVIDPVDTGESFYHVGLLPAVKDVLFPVYKEGEREVSMKVIGTPWDAWSKGKAIGLNRGMNLFVAKARQWLGISVHGFHFPSTNEYVEMGEDNTTRATFPGGVAKMDDERLKQVVKACYRTVIRYRNGFSKMDDPTSQTELIDLETGKKPESMTDAEWSAYKAHNTVPVVPVFNPKTDKYVAEFVYITKLDKQLSSDDLEDYAKNPNRFHFQFVGPVKRDFFTDPPKSVAEQYPKA